MTPVYISKLFAVNHLFWGSVFCFIQVLSFKYFVIKNMEIDALS